MTPNSRPSWELGGLVEADRPLDRPARVGKWPRPAALDLRGGDLVWRKYEPDGGPPTRAVMGGAMLETFLRLAEADDEKIAAYARKWGVLGLCEHGLPATHIIDVIMGPGTSIVPLGALCPLIRASKRPWYREPAAEWRTFARDAAAVLTLAAFVHQGRVPKPSEWEAPRRFPIRVQSAERAGSGVKLHREWTAELVKRPTSIRRAREVVDSTIGDWLRWGQVGIGFSWPQRPQLTIQPLGLFGALALQMALAVAHQKGLALCTPCGNPYIPSRGRITGRRNYCDECRASGVPQRDASADYRARGKERRTGG